MFELIHNIALTTHIAIGAIALLVFWLPIIEKKGSPLHKKSGQWFVWGMITIAISGVIMTSLVIIDPLAVRDPNGELSLSRANEVAAGSRAFSSFLLMLSLLVLSTTRQSVLALKAKTNRQILKQPSHLLAIAGLFLSAIYVGLLGLERNSVLFQVFSVLSMFASFGLLRYIFKKEVKKGEWIIEHMSNIIVSGIAAYTAFFVFGGQAFLSEFVPSDYRIVFWVLPGVLGGVLSRIYENKYRKVYNVA
jgi:magnesium-transporting ATPase (P-type)